MILVNFYNNFSLEPGHLSNSKMKLVFENLFHLEELLTESVVQRAWGNICGDQAHVSILRSW